MLVTLKVPTGTPTNNKHIQQKVSGYKININITSIFIYKRQIDWERNQGKHTFLESLKNILGITLTEQVKTHNKTLRHWRKIMKKISEDKKISQVHLSVGLMWQEWLS